MFERLLLEHVMLHTMLVMLTKFGSSYPSAMKQVKSTVVQASTYSHCRRIMIAQLVLQRAATNFRKSIQTYGSTQVELLYASQLHLLHAGSTD